MAIARPLQHDEELLLWTHNGNYYEQISLRIGINQIEIYIFRVWINCSLVKSRCVVNLSLHRNYIGVECSKYVVGYDLASHASY